MKGEYGTTLLLLVGVTCLAHAFRETLPRWAACLLCFAGGLSLSLAVRRIYRKENGR